MARWEISFGCGPWPSIHTRNLAASRAMISLTEITTACVWMRIYSKIITLNSTESCGGERRPWLRRYSGTKAGKQTVRSKKDAAGSRRAGTSIHQRRVWRRSRC